MKEIHVRVEESLGAVPPVGYIDPGDEFTLPTFTGEGVYAITYFSVDALGNSETPQTLLLRIDRTAPTVAGLPSAPCRIWPPNHKMVHVAVVVGQDSLSGVARVEVTGSSSEPDAGDIRIVGGSVDLRAERDDEGPGRFYTLTATVTDNADNATTEEAICVVPHHQTPWRTYSHSMVPGGFEVRSRATRLTSRTSLVIRVEIRSRMS